MKPVTVIADAPLAQPFPRWINQWAFPVFLVCMLLPVTLLTFVRQPVYTRLPCLLTQVGDGPLIVVRTSKDIMALNSVGEKVPVTIAFPGYKQEVEYTGYIQSIISLNEQEYEMSIQLDAAGLTKNSLSGTEIFNATVLLKERELRMIEKIFH
jgi:hypothetical protein